MVCYRLLVLLMMIVWRHRLKIYDRKANIEKDEMRDSGLGRDILPYYIFF